MGQSSPITAPAIRLAQKSTLQVCSHNISWALSNSVLNNYIDAEYPISSVSWRMIGILNVYSIVYIFTCKTVRGRQTHSY